MLKVRSMLDGHRRQRRVIKAMILSAAGAALGGILVGFDTAFISEATSALQQEFALSDTALDFTVASALIGTVIGSLVARAATDRFRRKPVEVNARNQGVALENMDLRRVH